jgi:hypothetical protein
MRSRMARYSFANVEVEPNGKVSHDLVRRWFGQ